MGAVLIGGGIKRRETTSQPPATRGATPQPAAPAAQGRQQPPAAGHPTGGRGPRAELPTA
eukprot:9876555-Lingulodinium_polyedra.AAC.1